MSQQPGTHQELREVELKSVVDDAAAARVRLERFGAKLVFAGRLEDRRYDLTDRGLEARDEALRVRIYRNADGALERCSFDWKGPASLDRGYKVRSELSVDVTSDTTLTEILSRLGYSLSREVDRQIAQYELEHAIIRFEYYPRMDDLIEIEGDPESIERAIAATGLPREGFSSDALRNFVARYEERTGTRAALSDREMGVDVTQHATVLDGA